MVRQIIYEEPIALAEVKELMDRRRRKGGEPTYEQKQTTEYVKEFGKVSPKKARDMVKRLEELGIEKAQAVKLIDIMPEDEEDIKLVFAKAHYSLDEENIEKVLKILWG